MPQTIVDLLKRGVQANNSDSFRRGNLIHLPEDTQLVITGDIHGHRRNFERMTSFADLANNPNRHILLQEIIHGGPEDKQGGCLSYMDMLLNINSYATHEDLKIPKEMLHSIATDNVEPLTPP